MSAAADANNLFINSEIPSAPPLDPRLPEWDLSALQDRPCPVCGGCHFTPLVRRPDGLVVATCAVCTLHYLPRIPLDQLATFYARYSETHQKWASSKTAEASLRAARRRTGRNGLLNEIGRRHRLKGQRLLEIGCSTGSFLLDARQLGATVVGVDIDQTAQAFVTGSLGIPCHSTLGAAAADGPYDIVVALNVIEHLPSPAEWLGEVAHLMTSGGLLVVVTPNGGEADVLGPSWVGFRVDLDHLNYFSPGTLGRVLVGAGFWTEAVWEFKQPELSAFRPGEPPPARGWLDRLLGRSPVDRVWSMPQFGGRYTLCAFATLEPAAPGAAGI